MHDTHRDFARSASRSTAPRRRFCQWVLGFATLPAGGWAVRAAPADDPQKTFDEAVRLFFAGRPAESVKAFDALVTAQPAAEPHLWQRGLALYYAGRFAAGRRQFELHRTVNPADVENATWHFACVARDQGADAAQAALLPVGADRRVPMREIYDLYAGRGSAAAVLDTARSLLSRQRYEDAIRASAEAAQHARAAYTAATAEAERRRLRRQQEVQRRQLEESFARMSRSVGPWVVRLPGGTVTGPDPWRSLQPPAEHSGSARGSAQWSRDIAQAGW
ncbi:MAG: hypothetical protein EBR23_00485 [Planctomycetia bacterium]|nr:hypothetical protein [Planctomycetia bacterium]